MTQGFVYFSFGAEFLELKRLFGVQLTQKSCGRIEAQ